MASDQPQEPKSDVGSLTFEVALSRLDETVQSLEAGGLSLAEATRLFQERMKVARVCGEPLAVAEPRITRVQTAYGEQTRMLEGWGLYSQPGHTRAEVSRPSRTGTKIRGDQGQCQTPV